MVGAVRMLSSVRSVAVTLGMWSCITFSKDRWLDCEIEEGRAGVGPWGAGVVGIVRYRGSGRSGRLGR